MTDSTSRPPVAAGVTQKRRKPSGEVSHICPFCSRQFKRSEHKERHVRTRKLSPTTRCSRPPSFRRFFIFGLSIFLQPARSITHPLLSACPYSSCTPTAVMRPRSPPPILVYIDPLSVLCLATSALRLSLCPDICNIEASIRAVFYSSSDKFPI